MYYAQMRKYDVANGTGIRATLFVSGCTHNCKGCFSKPYQDFRYGDQWTLEAEEKFLSYAKMPNVHGVTILGGEPMEQIEDDDLFNLLTRIKQETHHSIWIYSGYTFEEIKKHNLRLKLLQLCDVLVEGPFIDELKDITLKFRGSRNQRIVNIQESLTQDSVILMSI